MEDFQYIDRGSGRGEYHHEDDIVYCDDIEEYVLDGDAHYSDLLDAYYYDEDDMESDENDWKERHGWFFAECEEKWYECEDEITTWKWYYNSDGTWDEETIGVETVERKVRNGVAVCVDGVYYEKHHYDKYLRMTPVPYREVIDLCAAF